MAFGLARKGEAQALLYGGPTPIVQTPVSLNLGAGVSNTKQIGSYPAVWGIDVAFNSSEVQSGQDLDFNGAVADPLGGVVRILDLDAKILTNTIVQGSRTSPDQVTITQISAPGLIYVAWISREDQLFNVPNFLGLDLNSDGDNLDFVVMIMSYKGNLGPAVPGTMWAFVPPASVGLSTGYRAVHMSTQILVVEQGFPTPLLFVGGGMLPAASALPICVIDLIGFGSPQFTSGGAALMPNPIPLGASAGAGYVPRANFDVALAFPVSWYIVYEQREVDLGVDANADGDQCDRVIAFQQITNSNPNCPVGLVCPPAFATITVTLAGPCQMGVENFPSARPDATFGQYLGFDVIPAG